MSRRPARPSGGPREASEQETTGGAVLPPAAPPAPAMRVAAGVVVAAGALVLLVLECFLVPLRIAGVVAPLALLLEAVFHPLLCWLMWKTTRSRAAVLIPIAIWALLVFFLGRLTPAGDAIIAGNSWMPFAFLLVGTAAFVVSIVVLLPRPRPAA